MRDGPVGRERDIEALLALLGELLLAAEALVAILRDSVSESESSDRAHALLSRYAELLLPDHNRARSRGYYPYKLEDILAILQDKGSNYDGQGRLWVTCPTVPARGEGSQVEPLTRRELSVLALMAAGLSNREIAEQLVITQGTTKWYVSEILSKLHVRSRTQAVRRAQALGLLR